MQVGVAGEIVIGLVVGLILGGFHFSSLSWNARLFAAGAAGKAIALQVGRIAVAVAALIALARLLGLAALLCGGLGFLVARPLLLWRFGALR
jgi:F1F0 ATPase subunit 2